MIEPRSDAHHLVPGSEHLALLDRAGRLICEERDGNIERRSTLPCGLDWDLYWQVEDRPSIREMLEEAQHGKARAAHARAIDTNVLWELHAERIAEGFHVRLSEVVEERRSARERAHLGAFLRLLPGTTWTADAHGRLDGIDDAWSASRGRQAQAALGSGWLDNLWPDDRARVSERWRRCIATGEVYDTKFRARFRDGSYRWQVAHAEPLRDERGAITGWAGVTIDINDHYHALEQHGIFRSLAENSLDLIAIFDLDGLLIYCNDAGRTLLGIFGPPAEAGPARCTLAELLTGDDRERLAAEIVAYVSSSGRWGGQIELASDEGAAIPVSASAFGLTSQHGEQIGLAIVARDVRERLRFESNLRILAESGPAFFDNLDAERTLRNIAQSLVENFATFCVIDVLTAKGEFQRVAFAHRDKSREHALDFQAPQLPNLPRDHFVKRTLLDGESSVARVDDAWISKAAVSKERADHLRGLGFDSLICVPIRSKDGILGALSCGLSRADSGRYYDNNDLLFGEELARRAGLALFNARRYERERRIALTFQEQALPAELPHFRGVHCSAAYRPGNTEARVGGDWYDAFPLDDGRIAIVVGDVVGNGLQAAALMNKLRQAMQTAALIYPEPNFVLDAGDRMLRMHDADMYATALVAVYNPLTKRVIFASAGHPGPLVVDADGTVTQHASPGMLLGLRTAGAETAAREATLDSGSMIFFYTDGLIEISRDLERGQANLEATLRRPEVLASEDPARAVVEALLGERAAEDDIAVFALRIDGVPTASGFTLHYHDVELAHGARKLFGELLSGLPEGPVDPAGAELVFGELLGNVARHAPGAVTIEVSFEDGTMTLAVVDHGPGFELAPRLPGEFAENHRGLFLVYAFADEVAVEHVPGKTTTRVRFTTRPRAVV